MSSEAMNYFIVGGVGLEPTCPAGSGFTGRRANQLLNPPKTFVGLESSYFSVGYHLCVLKCTALNFVRVPRLELGSID